MTIMVQQDGKAKMARAYAESPGAGRVEVASISLVFAARVPGLYERWLEVLRSPPDTPAPPPVWGEWRSCADGRAHYRLNGRFLCGATTRSRGGPVARHCGRCRERNARRWAELTPQGEAIEVLEAIA